MSYLNRNTINENEYLHFNDTYKREDGIVYKSKAEYSNLTFTLAEKKAFMEGSLHKYYNIRHGLGDQNYTQFNYDQILWVINDLNERFEINPTMSKILNIEYGVNLLIEEHPSELLKSNVIFYKSKYPNSTDFKGKGFLQEFEYDEYKIKMYDKGSQYNIGQNLLRFEIRTKKSRNIGEKFGIRYLSDLYDRDNLINLHKDLKEKLNNVFIYDCLSPPEGMTLLENHLFTKSQSRSFFFSMKGPSKYNKATRARTDIREILSNYSLNTMHKALLKKLDLKKEELFKMAC